MARLHLIIGLVTLAAFIGTGVYLHFELPAIIERDATLRFTHRANHIYLLLAGLVNIMAGVSRTPHPRRWRCTMQTIGSCGLLISPLVLLVAFVLEADSVNAFRPVTAIGVMIAFAGVILHLFGIQRSTNLTSTT